MDLFLLNRQNPADAMKSSLAGPPSPLHDIRHYHLGMANLKAQPTSTPASKILRPTPSDSQIVVYGFADFVTFQRKQVGEEA